MTPTELPSHTRVVIAQAAVDELRHVEERSPQLHLSDDLLGELVNLRLGQGTDALPCALVIRASGSSLAVGKGVAGDSRSRTAGMDPGAL